MEKNNKVPVGYNTILPYLNIRGAVEVIFTGPFGMTHIEDVSFEEMQKR